MNKKYLEELLNEYKERFEELEISDIDELEDLIEYILQDAFKFEFNIDLFPTKLYKNDEYEKENGEIEK